MPTVCLSKSSSRCLFPNTQILYPAYDSVNVSSNPTISFTGPANWQGLNLFLDAGNNYFDSANLSASVTSWRANRPLHDGANTNFIFFTQYVTNGSPYVILPVPTNIINAQPISNWTTGVGIILQDASRFSIGNAPTNLTSHTLVAHYNWNGSFPDALSASLDVSGNGNNVGFGAGGGPNGGVTLTGDAEEGGQAVQFHNPDGNSLGSLGVVSPSGVIDALAGSFTVSCWIKTTQTFGSDDSHAFDGAGIIAADATGLANDVVPLALTGSKIASTPVEHPMTPSIPRPA